MNVGIQSKDLAMKSQQRALVKPSCLRHSGEPERGQRDSLKGACACAPVCAVSAGI